MVGLESGSDTAVPAAAVVQTDQVQPLRRRVSTRGHDFSGTPEPPDNAEDLGVREAIRGDRRLRTLAIACVVVALVRTIFLAMSRAPSAHRVACFRGVLPDPLAPVRATHFWIRMRHGHPRSRPAGP